MKLASRFTQLLAVTLHTGYLSLFGAPKIDFKDAEKLSDSAPEIIAWAAPVMFFFVLLEWFVSWRETKDLQPYRNPLLLPLLELEMY